MKKTIVILLTLFISACSTKNEIQKPEKLIEKGEMENILYDLALLQALKSYSPQKLKDNSINPKTYIYQKYKIDSAQFAENNKYYASNMNEYKLIFENVATRLQKQKAQIDTILKKEEKIKSKKAKDSVIKSYKMKEALQKQIKSDKKVAN